MKREEIKNLLKFGRDAYIFRIEYEDVYGTMYCKIYLVPEFKHKTKFGYMVSEPSGDFDKAFTKLLELKRKASRDELICPTDDDQKYNNGYFHNKITDFDYVQWKRVDNVFFVHSIYSKDSAGFYILDKPLDLENYRNAKLFTYDDVERFVPDMSYLERFKNDYTNKIQLRGDEYLYMWDDIGFLSGSAGLLVVRDGKVVKELVIIRS